MTWRVYSPKTRKARKVPVRAEVAGSVRRLPAEAPPAPGAPPFRNRSFTSWWQLDGPPSYNGTRLGATQTPAGAGH
jgi:hypothetical protein